MAKRVERRTGDLTSALIDIHDEDPEAFTLEEIASICFSLSFAGHETTNYLIGNVVRRLLEDPTRWARVVADPAAIPGAVEETLRFDPSVCVWRRVTTRPARSAASSCPRARSSSCGWRPPAATPSVFPEPDAFDLDRDNARRHLAFGRGIHYCLGASLGKLEAELAVAELARRFPRLALVEDQELTLPPEHLLPRAAGAVGGGWRRRSSACVCGAARAYCISRGEADPGRRGRGRSSSAGGGPRRKMLVARLWPNNQHGAG